LLKTFRPENRQKQNDKNAAFRLDGEGAMKVLFAAAATLLLLCAHAFAQANQVIDPEKLPENVAIDQKYRNALKRLPDPEASHDPWRSVRSSEQDGKSKSSSKKMKAN
jgi:hypothetical protein